MTHAAKQPDHASPEDWERMLDEMERRLEKRREHREANMLSRVVDEFMVDAQVAIAGAVSTPEKGYLEDGGLQQLLADIKQLRKKYDVLKSAASDREWTPAMERLLVEIAKDVGFDHVAGPVKAPYYRQLIKEAASPPAAPPAPKHVTISDDFADKLFTNGFTQADAVRAAELAYRFFAPAAVADAGRDLPDEPGPWVKDGVWWIVRRAPGPDAAMFATQLDDSGYMSKDTRHINEFMRGGWRKAVPESDDGEINIEWPKPKSTIVPGRIVSSQVRPTVGIEDDGTESELTNARLLAMADKNPAPDSWRTSDDDPTKAESEEVARLRAEGSPADTSWGVPHDPDDVITADTDVPLSCKELAERGRRAIAAAHGVSIPAWERERDQFLADRDDPKGELVKAREEVERLTQESAKRNHGATGMCCQLRLQEKARADELQSQLTAALAERDTYKQAAELLEKRAWPGCRIWRAMVKGETCDCSLCKADAERDKLAEECERLRTRLLTAAGDDLCRLTQEEIKAMSAGDVKIPPKDEFLASCERFHAQVAKESGVMENCLTLAQLIAENEKLRAERDAAHAEIGGVKGFAGWARDDDRPADSAAAEMFNEITQLKEQVAERPKVIRGGPGVMLPTNGNQYLRITSEGFFAVCGGGMALKDCAYIRIDPTWFDQQPGG